MDLEEIKSLPVERVASKRSHLYLWVPNALLKEGLEVMEAWGFKYKTNIIWNKVRKDGEPDGRGVGFYFRNTTEIILFGTRGTKVRTLKPGRTQVNMIRTKKENIQENLMSYIKLLRNVVGVLILNFLQEEQEKNGPVGAIKVKNIKFLGKPTN